MNLTRISNSRKIARLASRSGGDPVIPIFRTKDSPICLVQKRARLIGTAERKIERLVELLKEEDEIKHTLVYCGDGTVEGEIEDRTRRHVDATETTLRADPAFELNASPQTNPAMSVKTYLHDSRLVTSRPLWQSGVSTKGRCSCDANRLHAGQFV